MFIAYPSFLYYIYVILHINIIRVKYGVYWFFINCINLYSCYDFNWMEARVPLVSTNSFLQNTIGFLFKWKVMLLIIAIILSIIVFRPFCRFIYLLGAIYSLFNPISLYRLNVNDKCIKCKACSRKCKFDINIYENPNSPEYICCGECIKACTTKALNATFNLKQKSK